MATADIIRFLEGSVSQRLFGRDCTPCVKAFVCVIFFIDRSPLLIRRATIEHAALRRNFSLGRTVTIVAERLLADFFASCKIREIRQQAARSNYFDRILRRARSEIGAECRYHAMSGHRILPGSRQPFLPDARGANAPIGLQRQPKLSAKCDGLTNRRKRSRRTGRYRRLRTAPPIQARFDRPQIRYRSRRVTDGFERCRV
jgi:hypothetical protein